MTTDSGGSGERVWEDRLDRAQLFLVRNGATPSGRLARHTIRSTGPRRRDRDELFERLEADNRFRAFEAEVAGVVRTYWETA